MSIGEILRIVFSIIGVIIFAAILISFVRGRSAQREQALTETAAKYRLKYTPGGRDFFQSSWPGKVDGVYRGRKLAFQYKDKPYMSPRGYRAANYWAQLEIGVKNPGRGSLSLEGRGADALVTSKPEAFAATVLGNSSLKERLARIATGNAGRVNVVNTGTVAFTSNRIYRNSVELIEIVDALNDLADVVEAQPVGDARVK